MSAMAEGPALKRQRLAEVASSTQVDGLCTEGQKLAIQRKFAKFSTAQLTNVQVDVLNLALQEIITDEAVRLVVVSALCTATRVAPPTPVPLLAHGPLMVCNLSRISHKIPPNRLS